MKKLFKILAALVVLLLLALVVASFFIGDIIKKGVETVGPQVTKVEVKLGGASLSLLGGSGSVSGLVVGNPPGYKSESAIKVGKASLALSPGSVFSDKVVIKSINVQTPEITIEGGLNDNNLTAIQKNVAAFTGPSTDQPAAGKDAKSASKKLQVDEFIVSGAKVNAVIMGRTVPFTIPEIKLTGLGQGPEGITAADLTKRFMDEVIKGSLDGLVKAASDLSKVGADAAKEATKAATDTLNKTTKGIGDLFKKK